MNQMRTGILLACLTGLFLAVGYLLGGQGGMVIAFLVALAMNAFSYWNADRIVLGIHGAREVDRAAAPELHAIVSDLARRAGLPMPRVYVIDNDQPNAFATGRDPAHAAVAATTGLLALMSREEIAGVMAHELAHVKNRDTLIMTVTATIAGAISMLANFAMFFGGNRNNNMGFLGSLALMILAPLTAALVQMAISRTREYAADREGAAISGKPLALASALARLEEAAHTHVNQAAERNPATAHLFIINPLSGRGADNLFSTHPKTANRIAALEKIAGTSLASAGDRAERTSRRAAPWGETPTSSPAPSPTSRAPRGPWG